MSCPRLALCALLIATPLLAQSSSSAQDGLTILQQMSEHYAAAGSWYITASEEETSQNEYSRGWTKTVMIGAVSGNKYHYEGHSQFGSALHISNGKTAWDVRPEERAYTQETAPADGYQHPKGWMTNEMSAQRAVDLKKQFADFAKHYNSATRLPDEVLVQNGIKVPCYVVKVSTAQRKGSNPPGYSLDETLWIDKAAWTVRKKVGHSNTFLYSGTARIPLVQDTVTTYETVELNSPAPDALFHFDPPTDAKLVAKFDDSMFGPDMTGDTAPDVQLVGVDGRKVALSSYRGKPVLLDFWATWCKPCMATIPKLAEIDRDAAPKGLVTLSVDEDEDEKTATDFLTEHKYTWPNTHDDGKIGDAFKKLGIPLFVLIDAQGKIVFYKMADNDTELRKAVAGLGTQFASLAPVQKPQPCETASK